MPIDLWAATEVKDDLQRLFAMDYDALLEALGVDFRVVHGPSLSGLEVERYPDGSFRDYWGVRRIEVTYGEGDRQGSYSEVAESPLASMATAAEIDSYPGWPSADRWDYSRVLGECRRHEGACVIFVGDRLDRTAQLKTAMYLRGMEQFMIDLVSAPAIVERILDHVVNYYLEYDRRVFEAAAEAIDVFMMGDDFGMQTGPMMHLETWERYFEPGFRAYIALAHQYGLKVMHHTCGSVHSLIPHFIDAGLDILQSLQPRAARMDLAELKREFGRDLAFHGSIDIQQTMPYGTPEDVRREVQASMQAGKPGGGFAICTAHNLQRDVPLENILALLEAYHEFGAYA